MAHVGIPRVPVWVQMGVNTQKSANTQKGVQIPENGSIYTERSKYPEMGPKQKGGPNEYKHPKGGPNEVHNLQREGVPIPERRSQNPKGRSQYRKMCPNGNQYLKGANYPKVFKYRKRSKKWSNTPPPPPNSIPMYSGPVPAHGEDSHTYPRVLLKRWILHHLV